MFLEDYREALIWAAQGIPDPSKWVTDERHRADSISLQALFRW